MPDPAPPQHPTTPRPTPADPALVERSGTESTGDVRLTDVRLTLAEEQLAVGTRAVQAGEVGIRKTVDTERVRRTVPVAREEVTVERRPATGLDAATAQVEVTDDEIRIPIFAEEVVVEKRLVPKEEYVVRKRRVTETRTVEADLRRERLEVAQVVDERVDEPGSGAR